MISIVQSKKLNRLKLKVEDNYILEVGNLHSTGRQYKKTFKMGNRVQFKDCWGGFGE